MIREALCAALIGVACGGSVINPIGTCNDGGTYCATLAQEEMRGGICCPIEYPYCGVEDTNCPVGKCCNNPPN